MGDRGRRTERRVPDRDVEAKAPSAPVAPREPVDLRPPVAPSKTDGPAREDARPFALGHPFSMPFGSPFAQRRHPTGGAEVMPRTSARWTLDGRGTPAPDRIGPYEILSKLGSGGMAVVYKAVQPALGRTVAIKTLRSDFLHDGELRARFEREAQSLATLQHGNIVHVYDYLESAESAHIVMEYVDGVDLFDLLQNRNPFPPEVAALVALAVAEGLEHAHFAGIVHRDVKPSNVLLSRRGEVKLMDFGIARDPTRSELTQVGLAVGTPAYMAPEQIRGDRIGPAADIFALGVVLYEMLAGSKPWPEEDGRSITVRVLDEPPVPLPRVVPMLSDELVRITHQCLEKDPARRHASTHAVRRMLERFVDRAVQEAPRARLVVFLKNRNVLAATEAAPLASPELLIDPDLARRDRGEPPAPASTLFRPVLASLAGALCLLAVAAVLAATAPLGTRVAKEPPAVMLAPRVVTPAVPEQATKSPPAGVAPQARGALKVVVRPWARVLINGRFHDFTPFAAPIPLAPGDHRVGLRNPYYEPADHIVHIKPGERTLLKVALIPLSEPDP